jgi:hypothetical protein
MEPLDDHELKRLTQTWKAAEAPEHLHRRVFGTARAPWWAWMFTGAIRVPVPACVAIALLLAWLAFGHTRPDESPVPSTSDRTVTLADFQPPAEVQVRVVGTLP